MRIEFKRGVGAKGTHGREREQHEALRGGGEIFQHECHHPERASEVGNKMPENWILGKATFKQKGVYKNLSKETEKCDQRHIRKRVSERWYANPGKTDRLCKRTEWSMVSTPQAGRIRSWLNTMLIPASLSAELTLLVKSSSTKVATLPLMPMKRFTLVRTT